MSWLAIAISILTIVGTEFRVRKHWVGWLLSLVNQSIWLVFIISIKQWGLLPLSGYKAIQSVRGTVRWYREGKKDEQEEAIKVRDKVSVMEDPEGRLPAEDEGDGGGLGGSRVC